MKYYLYYKSMNKWNSLATEKSLHKTIEALRINGINAMVVETSEEAKNEVLRQIPKKSKVFTVTSKTVDSIGLADDLNDSGNFDSVRSKFNNLLKQGKKKEMKKLGAAPDFVVGSVHAVTEDGKVIIASNSGSQLPAYAYGADKVIWVVGSQKIVKNFDDAMSRINEYVLPLESDRARKAYGVQGSNVSKLLVISREVNPERISMVLVKEKLGF